jgi:protein arginine N-methyltransferase 2
MAFKDTILNFEDNKITTDGGMEVMMDWEAPIMEKSAEFICQGKGDILEIGFGMGIFADYIQTWGVNSHTIVEIHPQIIEKLKIWAEDKDNVIIVEGDWNSVEGLGKYDGIFLDTYKDNSIDDFKLFAANRTNAGAKITYWNNLEKGYDYFDYGNVEYETISVSPDSNHYTDIKNKYFMPKVTI